MGYLQAATAAPRVPIRGAVLFTSYGGHEYGISDIPARRVNRVRHPGTLFGASPLN